VVGAPTSLVTDAHAAGLFVHLYTLRDDPYFLPSSYSGNVAAEYRAFIDLGVDGFFTDFPGTGNAVLASRYLADYGISSSTQYYDDLVSANLGRSGGYEGLAGSPDGKTLFPLLEKTVTGDPAGSLRVYRFDVDSKMFTGLAGFYRMDKTTHAIGDFTPINDHEFIVIERDGSQANLNGFKKLFKIDISQTDAQGYFPKQELANLLTIQDPSDLNGDANNVYAMTFETIEDVLVLDASRLLVANDNNYPFSIGRPPAIDNNEMVVLQLDTPLDLDPRLGVSAAMGLAPNTVVATAGADDVVAGPLFSPGSFDGRGDVLFTGAGNDTVDVELGTGYENRIFTGSGADVIYAGSRDVITGGSGDDVISATDGDGNRLSGMGGDDEFIIGTTGNRALGGSGRDKFTILEAAGINYLNGGAGADQFWLVSEPGDRPASKQVVMDFSAGEDKVGLRGLSFLALSFSQVGADTLLSSSGAAIGHFNNLSVSTLNNQANFLFS